jgi:hypothetical protein
VTCTEVNTYRSTTSRDKRRTSSNDIASDDSWHKQNESWHKHNKQEINADIECKLFLFAGNIWSNDFYLSSIKLFIETVAYLGTLFGGWGLTNPLEDGE